ncbi:hypothetical protein [Candidatus Palauibacter sp.]|uniref:hypothetical protein n=1 Tax=Candidatus Palauibacter sp. TaxID=3101350 RepID=UPI003AF2D453
MSIISFHRFLITTAIVFCAVFAAWEFRIFATSGSLGALALGVGFAFAAAALAYYLANLARFLKSESPR